MLFHMCIAYDRTWQMLPKSFVVGNPNVVDLTLGKQFKVTTSHRHA